MKSIAELDASVAKVTGVEFHAEFASDSAKTRSRTRWHNTDEQHLISQAGNSRTTGQCRNYDVQQESLCRAREMTAR